METIFYVYKTTNLINGKIYVGKHKCFKQHDKRYLGSGKLLKRAIEKYGIENFVQEILEYTDSEEKNREQEIYWIQKLKSQVPNGYNISPGGLGGFTNYDEESHKWSALNTWNNLSEEEHNKRVLAIQNGIKKPEVLEKISKASKEWHASLTDDERKEYSKKCSDGWTEEKKLEAGKRCAERNRSLKGKSILEVFVMRYGKIEGEKHYAEYLEKQRIANLKTKKTRLVKAKETLKKKQLFPQYKEYLLQKALIQNMRTLLKRGKMSQEEFNLKYNDELLKFEHLKEDLRRFLDGFNNGKTI